MIFLEWMQARAFLQEDRCRGRCLAESLWVGLQILSPLHVLSKSQTMMLITQHEAGCTLSPLRVRSDMCAGRLLFTSLNFFFTVWGMENRLSGHVSTAPGAAQSKLFF